MNDNGNPQTTIKKLKTKNTSKCDLKRELFIGQGLLFTVSTRDMKEKIPINEIGL